MQVRSQIKGWSGPLLNMADCELSGPHNAENIMAALLVGRTLRIPLDAMKRAIQAFKAPAHRGEWVMDIGGVRYINDSKATNPHATLQALRGISAAKPGEPQQQRLQTTMTPTAPPTPTPAATPHPLMTRSPPEEHQVPRL